MRTEYLKGLVNMKIQLVYLFTSFQSVMLYFCVEKKKRAVFSCCLWQGGNALKHHITHSPLLPLIKHVQRSRKTYKEGLNAMMCFSCVVSHSLFSFFSFSHLIHLPHSCLHYFDHFSSLSLFFHSLSQIVGVSLMHVYWAHIWSMSSHRGNTGQGQPAQV